MTAHNRFNTRQEANQWYDDVLSVTSCEYNRKSLSCYVRNHNRLDCLDLAYRKNLESAVCGLSLSLILSTAANYFGLNLQGDCWSSFPKAFATGMLLFGSSDFLFMGIQTRLIARKYADKLRTESLVDTNTKERE